MEEDNELRDFSVQFDNEIHPFSGHDLKAGMSFSKLDAHYYSILNDTTDLLRRESEAQMGSVYLQDKWNITHFLDLTVGVRGTHYDVTAENYVEPRASAVYTLNDWLSFKGAWGRYHQFVNRITNEDVLEGSRDFWMLADEEVAVGYAEHWISGLSMENGEYLLDLEGYHKDLDGVVEYTRRANYNRELLDELRENEVAPGTAFFQGTGVSKGVDILAQKKRGKFTGWIGYSLSRVRYNVPGLNGNFSYPASHDRTHEVNIVAKLSQIGRAHV